MDLNQEIRLAVIPTLAPFLIPLFLQNFRTKHPAVQLHILEQQTETIVENLRSNQIDIGLLVTPLGEEKIIETPLFEEVFRVYAHKNSTLSGLEQVSDKDLKNEEILLLSEGHCMRDQMIRICKYRAGKGSSKQDFSVESGSIETLCRLVDAGMGYTIVPFISTLWPHSSEARIIKFSDPQPSREVSLAVHQSFAKNNVLDVLKKCIVSSLPKEITNHTTGLRRIRIR
jgi:LysR family hydrogen peroxide-inducible transcriptional activator